MWVWCVFDIFKFKRLAVHVVYTDELSHLDKVTQGEGKVALFSGTEGHGDPHHERLAQQDHSLGYGGEGGGGGGGGEHGGEARRGGEGGAGRWLLCQLAEDWEAG